MRTSEGTPVWGEGIRAGRSIRGWTQEFLAETAETSQATISRLENGSFEASDATRIKIARALGVDPHVLFPYVDAEERAS